MAGIHAEDLRELGARLGADAEVRFLDDLTLLRRTKPPTRSEVPLPDEHATE